jgi:hypothetical protein
MKISHEKNSFIQWEKIDKTSCNIQIFFCINVSETLKIEKFDSRLKNKVQTKQIKFKNRVEITIEKNCLPEVQTLTLMRSFQLFE